jgi:hypothetical protein
MYTSVYMCGGDGRRDQDQDWENESRVGKMNSICQPQPTAAPSKANYEGTKREKGMQAQQKNKEGGNKS